MSIITVLLPLTSGKSLFAYLKEKREEGMIFTEIREDGGDTLILIENITLN